VAVASNRYAKTNQWKSKVKHKVLLAERICSAMPLHCTLKCYYIRNEVIFHKDIIPRLLRRERKYKLCRERK